MSSTDQNAASGRMRDYMLMQDFVPSTCASRRNRPRQDDKTCAQRSQRGLPGLDHAVLPFRDVGRHVGKRPALPKRFQTRTRKTQHDLLPCQEERPTEKITKTYLARPTSARSLVCFSTRGIPCVCDWRASRLICQCSGTAKTCRLKPPKPALSLIVSLQFAHWTRAILRAGAACRHYRLGFLAHQKQTPNVEGPSAVQPHGNVGVSCGAHTEYRTPWRPVLRTYNNSICSCPVDRDQIISVLSRQFPSSQLTPGQFAAARRAPDSRQHGAHRVHVRVCHRHWLCLARSLQQRCKYV